MRQAFTLIELMIVIAIIAIIAAIAIPNLLESRVTSQEAAAASALKSGMLPAQVQFQAGGYCDLDNNGIGTYAVDGMKNGAGIVNPYNALCGSTTVGATANAITLNLLAPSYGSTTTYTSALATGVANTTLWPNVSGFQFKTPITATAPTGANPTGNDGTAEKVWGVLTFPSDDQQGRKFFMINQAGNIYMSKPANLACTGGADVGGLASSVNVANTFGVSMTNAPNSTLYLPYRR